MNARKTAVIAADAGQAEMREARPGRWRSVVRWSIGLGLLTAVICSVPARELLASLNQVAIVPLLGAVALSVIMQYLSTARLYLFARALALSWRLPQLLAIHFASLAYGLVLPGGSAAGSVIRLCKLSRGSRGFTAAAMMMLADRLAGTLTLGILGLACFFMTGPNNPPWLAVVFAGIVAICVLAHWIVACVPGARALQSALGVVSNFRSLPMAQRAQAAASRFLERLQTSRIPPGAMISGAVLSLAIHACGVLMFVLIARSVGIALGFWEIGLARAAMLAAVLLPISVAGLGLREGAAVLVLGGMNQGEGAALAFSLLAFAVGWLLPGLFGAVVEFASSRRSRNTDNGEGSGAHSGVTSPS